MNTADGLWSTFVHVLGWIKIFHIHSIAKKGTTNVMRLVVLEELLDGFRLMLGSAGRAIVWAGGQNTPRQG